MNSILFKIQDSVRKYADIISKISGIEVEVMDENMFRIAGTGSLANKINIDMSNEGNTYKNTLLSKKQQVITNPRENSICLDCKNRPNCKETFEISMPILLKKKSIGVIGMFSREVEQKERISKNLTTYLELLDLIAGFISVKALEYIERNEINDTLHSLGLINEYMTQGVIIIGKNNKIISLNKSAALQLNIAENQKGKKIEFYPTGDIIENMSEYRVELDGKEHSIVGYAIDVDAYSTKITKILLFSDLNTLKAQETPRVNPMAIDSIVGQSSLTLELKEEIVKIAHSNSTVLITGESGTGKEMVATAIWKASDRKDENFVAMNCAAIPENLLESELFGYVKGAFTGADIKGKIGKFELANNGIIFLDEIGDMPLYLQVKLLRVLQERTIVRIGSNQVIPLNIRVIASTNKNLKQMVETQEFREDLYYRLNVIPINIQPLRNRKDDIKELFDYFIPKYAKINNKTFKKIHKDAMEKLEKYPWPGNVRELENSAEFMINMMSTSGEIHENILPQNIKSHFLRNEKIHYDSQNILPLEVLEKREIIKALQKFGQSTQAKKMVAQSLGVGLATLYRKIEKYGLNSQNDNSIL